jgi:hypothetical protein
LSQLHYWPFRAISGWVMGGKSWNES